jgi:WW domain-containing oxidoreductase
MKLHVRSTFNRRSTAEEVLLGIDLSGKTVLLTGCNSGLGFETMRVLTMHGAHVLAAARTLETAQQACAQIEGSTTPMACDLSDVGSIRSAIATIAESGVQVDCIIANAGVMMLPRLEQCYGIEKQFFVNYLAHFMLINGILGSIPDHAGSRIVILSSSAHKNAPKAGVELDNLSGERGYNDIRAYGQSNVARILFARALSRRLESRGITANAVHPGIIGTTNLSRHLNPMLRALIRLFSKTIAQGAATQCYVAANPEVSDVTGQYFSDCAVTEPSEAAQDDDLGERLWTASEKLIAALP